MYKEVEIDVDLSDFETEDLIEELELRGELPESTGPYDSKLILQLRTVYGYSQCVL